MPQGGGGWLGPRAPSPKWNWPAKTAAAYLKHLQREDHRVAARIMEEALESSRGPRVVVLLEKLTGEELEALEDSLPASLGQWMRNMALERCRKELAAFIHQHPLIELAREAPDEQEVPQA